MSVCLCAVRKGLRVSATEVALWPRDLIRPGASDGDTWNPVTVAAQTKRLSPAAGGIHAVYMSI